MKGIFQINAGLVLISGLLLVGLFADCLKKAHVRKSTTDSATIAQSVRPDTPFHLDRSKRYVFLTFDDAPQLPGTINCKNVFYGQGVKATFFLVGMHVEMDRHCLRVADSLRNSYPQFLVANHSYSHAFRNHYRQYYSEPANALQDLMHAQDLLKAQSKIIRLPGSNAWVCAGENTGPKCTKAVRHLLDSMGYAVIGWDVEWSRRQSSPRESADEMIREVNSMLDSERTNRPNTIVILAHDRMFAKQQYADSLAKFVAILKSDPRNVFETIDHYPTGLLTLNQPR